MGGIALEPRHTSWFDANVARELKAGKLRA